MGVGAAGLCGGEGRSIWTPLCQGDLGAGSPAVCGDVSTSAGTAVASSHPYSGAIHGLRHRGPMPPPPPPRAGCWLPPSGFRSVTALALSLTLPAGMVLGPSRGASLPPPTMPRAALRLLCGVVMPAAMLCAEPLPRITFPSGEYTERAKWLRRGWGQAGLWWGDNIGLKEHLSPGLSTQHQGPTGCSPSQPSHLVSPAQGWGSGTAALGQGSGAGGSRVMQMATVESDVMRPVGTQTLLGVGPGCTPRCQL